jgi:cytochrome oxidase Cu insertion factor (SCO1/SenC/PrrC family)
MTTRRILLQAALGTGACIAASATRAQAPRPMLSGVMSNGQSVSLESLRGSVVLVFAWSTRCPVCLDKLPELRRNLDGWQGKPFVIVALNQDRNIDDMLGYQRLLEQTAPPRPQMKHLWRGAAAHRDNFGELPVNMPTMLIIDKEGALSKQLRGRVPAELWDDIAELVLG